MRLFFVVENNSPHASGGGYYAMFKFADFLARRGHEVLVYAVHDMSWLATRDRVQIVYRPNVSRSVRVLRKLDKLLEHLSDQLVLKPLVRRFKPDWVIGVLKESAIKAVRLGRKFHCPVANFVYECPPWLREVYGEDAYAKALRDRHTRRLWDKTRDAYRASDVLFPNSSLSMNYNRQWLDSNNVAEPIFPGVDIDQMPYDGERNHVNGKSALFVGRLVEDKNVHHLIEAWKRLPGDIVLDIVGSGPLESRLRQQAASIPNVRFHGFVEDEVLWRFFRSATLVVCPTRFEGFGMPPMQALYFGKPCLAADLPILRSIYGEHIDYFPVGDIDALVRGVMRIVNNPNNSSDRTSGRDFILGNFTWNVAAERIEASLLNYRR